MKSTEKFLFHRCCLYVIFLSQLVLLVAYNDESSRTAHFANRSERTIETIFSWDSLEFDMGNVYDANKSQSTENYLLGNVRMYENTFYISVPRYKEGVPATLNKIQILNDERKMNVSRRTDQPPNSPTLHPFPNLKRNKVGDCKALQNVVALEIDPLGRLWVVDSGKAAIYSYTSNYRNSCKAKLHIYQLGIQSKTQPILLTSFTFPRSVVSKNSVLMHLVLDFAHAVHTDLSAINNKNVHAYISDISFGNIIVFDWQQNHAFKKTAAQMKPGWVNFKILDSHTRTRSGVRGLALESGSRYKKTDQRLYFGTLSPQLYLVPTIALKHENIGEDITSWVSLVEPGRGGYCDAMTTDGDKHLYSAVLDRGCIVKYELSSNNSFHGFIKHIFICNPDKLLWINSIFWNDGYLYIITNRFHNYIRDQNENHIAEEKTRRMRYDILRVTPRENLTKNYMEWISSSASHKSSILEFKLSLIFISILISIMISWHGCQKTQL